MDFFAAQDRAHGQTRKLLLAFVAALVALVAALYAVAALAEFLAVGYAESQRARPGAPAVALWSLPRLLVVTALVLLVVGGASLAKISQFRAGGTAVAASLGGRRVDVTTRVPLERRLVNVVEEMAIASGISIPAIFILDDEPGINAFAAGYDPEEAAVAVSRGCLETLSRDELQGVVAHEFSHILNGDMRLNLRLAGVLFGLFALIVVGRGIFGMFRYPRMRAGGRSGSGKGGGGLLVAVLVVALALFLLGLVGQFFGRLIQAAISRQREFLADASAVQFTRHPAGIRDALRRIGGHLEGSRLRHPESETLAHSFFASALSSGFGGGFRTHPPLAERIRALDTSWDGSFLDRPARPPVAGTPPEPPGAGQAGELSRQAVTAMAGAVLLGREQLAYARRLRENLEGFEPAALADPAQAGSLVLALFIGPESAPAVPWPEIEAELGHPVREAVARWQRGPLAGLPRRDRVPLFELALPALRQLDEPSRRRLRAAVSTLVALDGEVSLREFILGALLQHRLAEPSGERRLRRPAFTHPRSARGPLERILSLLAWEAAGRDGDRARQWFEAAIAHRPRWKDLAFVPSGRPAFSGLEEDFRVAAQSGTGLKRELLELGRELILRDERVSENEADLFRLFVVTLGVPFSPMPEEKMEKNPAA